ncbi:MAG: hypothetical protein ABI520_15795 [Caldimonas sp.]
MTPADVERVFGKSRMQIPAGRHVEVFREEARSGEERRYTKRFLRTPDVDFRLWTERECRVLVRLGRLAGAPVPKVLDFLPAEGDGTPTLQTRDAGATLDQWATLVPLRRGKTLLRNVFDDCANWWALARQFMVSLDALHALGFVHLDLKPDNVCIPWAPAGAGRPVPGQPLAPRVKALALIDVAFSLVSEVDLPGPLPLLKHPTYDYQSPRLLHALEEGRRGSLAATRALDWRCDFFSLAAMLWRYLPEIDDAPGSGWTDERHGQATEFVEQLLDVHRGSLPTQWPHRPLIALATLRLRDPDLQAALQAGCTFDPERDLPLDAEPTPPTRIADHPPRPAELEPRTEGETENDNEGVAFAASPSDPRREPVFSMPAPRGEQRREPTVGSSVAAPTAPRPMAPSKPMPPMPPVAPVPSRPSPSRSRVPSEPPSEPGVAAVYSRPADLYEPTLPPPADDEPTRPLEPMPEPELAGEAGTDEPAAMPIRARRRHRPALVAAVAAAAVTAAAAAWWLSFGRTLFSPPTVVTIPLPSAREAELSRAEATPPLADENASRPVTIAAATAASAAVPTPAPAAEVAASASAELPAAPADNALPVPTPVEREPSVSADLDASAAELLQNRIPRAAAAAERQLARVLAVAAGAAELRRRGDVRNAMLALRAATPRAPFEVPVRGAQARQLNEQALAAYWRRDDVDEAVRLQTRAFVANPFDSEVVGNLAFLRLREQPPQAEAARQLALYSLTLNDPRFPTGRIEDWTALAVASALTGHEAAARNAWFASMALASDLQHQCSNAVRTEAVFGEKLRPSVRAMLQRARSSAAYGRCEAALAPQPARAKSRAEHTKKSPAKVAARTATKAQPRSAQRSTPRPRRAIP